MNYCFGIFTIFVEYNDLLNSECKSKFVLFETIELT